jgi:heat-inducible transcriptional repressor
MEREALTERERKVLSTIIRDYLVMAEPEGSRVLSRKSGLDLSPASIRNILSDLEEKGLVEQPHTSAARVPTDKGYRYYVDYLIELSELSGEDKSMISRQFETLPGGFEAVAAAASRILSSLSHQLGLVLSPRLNTGAFRRLSVMEVAEKRLMLVLTIESGLVNSIMVELEMELPATELQSAVDFINQRLAGRKLADIQQNLAEMVYTDDKEKVGTIRLFLDNYESLSDFPLDKIIHLSGTTNILGQPEFGRKEDLEAVIELMEDREMLVHVLDKRKLKEGVYVTIGGENTDGQFRSYSIVSSSYNVGGVTGALGIIGPRRMAYPKLIPVVGYTAELLSKKYDQP